MGMLLRIVKQSTKKIRVEVLQGKKPALAVTGKKSPPKSLPTPVSEKNHFSNIRGSSLKNVYYLQHYQVIWLDIRRI